MSVASFYDMFQLEPVGTHMVEVCTNVCCGLVNAQAVLEAFERELGIAPGETTADGRFTLSTVECLGSCGTAPVLMVNETYHEDMSPDRLDALIEGLSR
jgi:NADH-quinone oxidoreductase subunit E